MHIETYSIELRVSGEDDVHEAMTEVVKQYGRDLLATAMFLSVKNPTIAVRSSDSFYDHKEIVLLDPSEHVMGDDNL